MRGRWRRGKRARAALRRPRQRGGGNRGVMGGVSAPGRGWATRPPSAWRTAPPSRRRRRWRRRRAAARRGSSRRRRRRGASPAGGGGGTVLYLMAPGRLRRAGAATVGKRAQGGCFGPHQGGAADVDVRGLGPPRGGLLRAPRGGGEALHGPLLDGGAPGEGLVFNQGGQERGRGPGGRVLLDELEAALRWGRRREGARSALSARARGRARRLVQSRRRHRKPLKIRSDLGRGASPRAGWPGQGGDWLGQRPAARPPGGVGKKMTVPQGPEGGQPQGSVGGSCYYLAGRGGRNGAHVEHAGLQHRPCRRGALAERAQRARGGGPQLHCQERVPEAEERRVDSPGAQGDGVGRRGRANDRKSTTASLRRAGRHVEKPGQMHLAERPGTLDNATARPLPMFQLS